MNSVKKYLNQRGQGTVEYILITGLTVAIILGAVLQLNQAFKVWADNYFGEYLTCLLETGELPSLGGGSSNTECAAAFKPFNLADGTAGGKNGNGSGGGSTEEQEGDDPREGKPAARLGGVDGAGSSSGSSRGSRSGQRFAARPSGGSGDEDGDSKKGDEAGSGVIDRGSYDNNRNGSKRILVAESEEKKKRRIEEGKKDKLRTKVKSDKNLADERQGAPTLQKVLKRTPAAATDDDSGFDFTFGNLLRWLLILAIIIAIVLFIGGQILQVSKSVD